MTPQLTAPITTPPLPHHHHPRHADTTTPCNSNTYIRTSLSTVICGRSTRSLHPHSIRCRHAGAYLDTVPVSPYLRLPVADCICGGPFRFLVPERENGTFAVPMPRRCHIRALTSVVLISSAVPDRSAVVEELKRGAGSEGKELLCSVMTGCADPQGWEPQVPTAASQPRLVTVVHACKAATSIMP